MSLIRRFPLLVSRVFSFQNWSQQRCHCSTNPCPRIGILGVPFSKGQRRSGTETGPYELRNNTNLLRILRDELDCIVLDHGDIDTQNGIKDTIVKKIRNPHSVGDVSQKISEKVQSIIANEELCLTFGGDHSLAIGTVHGHAQVHPNLLVIWVDAHSDINTATTTNSGNMHGMPMSFHLHELHDYNIGIPGFEWLQPTMTGNDIVYIGLRDVEPLERLILEKCGIRVYSMYEVDRMGILGVVHEIIQFKGNQRPIHVSFDIDAYDVTVAPSTGTAVPGGLTLREGLMLGEEIYKTGQLAALDLVEVNAKLGSESDKEKTLYAATQTILSFLGNARGGNIAVNQHTIPIPQKE